METNSSNKILKITRIHNKTKSNKNSRKKKLLRHLFFHLMNTTFK
jgi:hypothetical protein